MVLVWGFIGVSDHPDGSLLPTIELIELVKSEDCIVTLYKVELRNMVSCLEPDAALWLSIAGPCRPHDVKMVEANGIQELHFGRRENMQ